MSERDNEGTATEAAPADGRCVRCGSPATRSCFLLIPRSRRGAAPGDVIDDEPGPGLDDTDADAQLAYVCERCIDRVIHHRRHVGVGGGGVLLFVGLLVIVGAYDDLRIVGLAVASAGVLWAAWTLLDTFNARRETARLIAGEEGPSTGRSA